MDNKIKNYLGIAGAVGIIVLAVVGWRFAGTYSNSLQPGGYPSYSVSAEGKTVVIPDIAQFTFQTITQGGTNLGDLQSQNSDKTNKVIDFLKKSGVENKDIQTTDYSVDPRYEYSNCGGLLGGTCPPPAIVGYTIAQTVSVKIRSLATVGSFLSGVVKNGANSVSSLQFTLDNTDAAKASARAEAFTKAEAKAKETAAQGGFRLGRLVSVQVNENDSQQIYYGMGASASYDKAAPMPSPSIQPGSKDIKVSVYLTYEIY